MTHAIAAAKGNDVMGADVAVDADRRHVSPRRGRHGQSRQGRRVPDQRARQPGFDADRPVLRRLDEDGEHRRDRNSRSVAGQRHDLRQAVHDSRQVDREADAAVGRERHLRCVQQQGCAARQSRTSTSRPISPATPATTRRPTAGSNWSSAPRPARTSPSASTSRSRSTAWPAPAVRTTAGTSPTATPGSCIGATR